MRLTTNVAPPVLTPPVGGAPVHGGTHDTPPTHGSHTAWARRALVAATLAIGMAYASALVMDAVPAWAPWLMAMGVPVCLVSVMALGAARHGRVPASLLAAFALVGLVLAGGFAFALLAPAGGLTGAEEPLLLGLPRRAAIIVYGIGLLPVLVLPVAYALTFEAQTLRDEDLARVRAAGVIAAAERERVAAARTAGAGR
jgi:hypothetical protein